jgi:hypothetical protein
MKHVAAGVVSKDGSLRIVVAPPSNLHYHLNEGERLFVLPDYAIETPPRWEEIPALVAKVEEFVGWQGMPSA